MTMPPKMLTARMMSPAIAARTNFDAPSIEPKKALSSEFCLRACATFSSMRYGREVRVDRHRLPE
jgi:hypothetical protein